MKRQADEQLIKGGRGEQENDDDPAVGMSVASADVLARRPMKGLPQRGARVAAAAPVPATSTPPSIFGSTPSASASSFSFGAGAGGPSGSQPSPSPFGTSIFGSTTPAATPPSTRGFGDIGMGQPSTKPLPPSIFGSNPTSAFSFSPAAPAPASESTKNTFSFAPAASATTSGTTTKAGFTFGSGTTAPASGSGATGAFSFTPSTTPFSAPKTSSFPTSSSPTNTAKAFASVLNNTASSPKSPTPAQTTSSTAADVPSPGKGHTETPAFTYYSSLRGLNNSLLSSIGQKVKEDTFIDLSELLEQYKSIRLRIETEYKDADRTGAGAKTAVAPETPTTPTPAPASKSAMPAMPAPPVVLSFGGAKFGSAASTTSAAAPPAQSAPTNPFNFSATSSSPASNPFEVKPASLGSSSSPFAFSTPATSSSSKPPPFSFGPSTTTHVVAPSGGFSFGAPAAPSPYLFGAAKTSSSPFGTSSFGSGSSFGGFGASAAPKSAATDEENTEHEGSATPTSDADAVKAEAEAKAMAMLAPNPLTESGEGEENEDTVYQVKSKAFRWTKGEPKTDSKPEVKEGWSALGVGQLKLKVDRTTKARRVLLRNTVNGMVILNFSIYSGMSVSQKPKSLTFIGHENGVSNTYLVRFGSDDEATNCKDALQKLADEARDK